jgi:hypothetical protein
MNTRTSTQAEGEGELLYFISTDVYHLYKGVNPLYLQRDKMEE